MATVREIGLDDQVELTESIEDAPVGATGAVIELHGDGEVGLVELTSMPAEPVLERFVFVPLGKLRRVGGGPASARPGS